MKQLKDQNSTSLIDTFAPDMAAFLFHSEYLNTLIEEEGKEDIRQVLSRVKKQEYYDISRPVIDCDTRYSLKWEARRIRYPKAFGSNKHIRVRKQVSTKRQARNNTLKIT